MGASCATPAVHEGRRSRGAWRLRAWVEHASNARVVMAGCMVVDETFVNISCRTPLLLGTQPMLVVASLALACVEIVLAGN